jgi:hypothetical protein
MRPYWIKVQRQREPTFLNLGAGVTARSETDAKEIFRSAFGSSFVIESALPVTDIRELDQNHVVLNMGNWLRRGVWFPLGYDQIAN